MENSNSNLVKIIIDLVQSPDVQLAVIRGLTATTAAMLDAEDLGMEAGMLDDEGLGMVEEAGDVAGIVEEPIVGILEEAGDVAGIEAVVGILEEVGDVADIEAVVDIMEEAIDVADMEEAVDVVGIEAVVGILEEAGDVAGIEAVVDIMEEAVDVADMEEAGDVAGMEPADDGDIDPAGEGPSTPVHEQNLEQALQENNAFHQNQKVIRMEQCEALRVTIEEEMINSYLNMSEEDVRSIVGETNVYRPSTSRSLGANQPPTDSEIARRVFKKITIEEIELFYPTLFDLKRQLGEIE
jgi:hypothetical protein